MKAACWILLTATIAYVLYFVAAEQPKRQEAKEASMLKFLHLYLYEYRVTHEQFPKSLEEAIEKGLHNDFPQARMSYLQKAMNEGRLHYTLTEEGGFRIHLTTNLDREITMDGFAN